MPSLQIGQQWNLTDILQGCKGYLLFKTWEAGSDQWEAGVLSPKGHL